MSYILVKSYDGDPTEYYDTEDNKGDLVVEASFCDGEELMAVTYIVELLDKGAHLDIRQRRD